MPASENNQRIEYGKLKTKSILMAKAEKGLLKTYLVTTETAGAYCIGSADSQCVSTYKRDREVAQLSQEFKLCKIIILHTNGRMKSAQQMLVANVILSPANKYTHYQSKLKTYLEEMLFDINYFFTQSKIFTTQSLVCSSYSLNYFIQGTAIC